MITKAIECYWGGKLKRRENFYGVEQLEKAMAEYGRPRLMWIVMRDEHHDVINSDIIPQRMTISEIKKFYKEY